ncbi:uncharacterized protein LOC103577166 [Microplitis demolitor]|uniref:uncharacterized protein LOC103577166 n=1 Tax=Microplitis demolitor TaxID=69319 RepID=UPI0004CD86FE|nr:uncharacterized protein LOC103577166 [Microplitis demolitor]
MSESVKNLMETSGDDKSLGNIAVDENVLANASTADSTIPNDSQSFTLADFDSSLQEIDSKKNKDNEELLAKAREHDAVQDGGAVEDSSLQRNINDDDKDNKNKDELMERMEEDEIIEGTPPDERVSPLKRPMAKRNGSEEPASKIQKIDTDVIEPVKSSFGSEANSTEHSQDDKSKDKVADANENTVKAIDGVKDTLANDKVEGESLSELSQALENVLEDKAEKDEAQDTVPDELVVKSSVTGDASKKSRQSIEVIFDKALAPPPKPKEVVELDEDGEKIVLDSSQEDEGSQASDSNTIVNNTRNKNKITNGNNSSKSSESDRTASMQSDLSDESGKINIVVKDNSVPIVVTLPSDNEADSSIEDNKSKIKTVPVEREFTIVMKVKCLLHVDSQNSKECVGKEVTAVYCENYPDLHSPSSRMNSDTSILADVSASDNKEISSPSSVSSNPHPLPYSLPPSRHSIVSTVSTSSSSSCASSVKSSSGSSTKSSTKDNPFSLPRGFAKHAKKPHDMNAIDESPEYIKHGWRNVNLITTNIIDHLNNEIATADLSAHNGSTNEHIDGPLTRMASSTPESKAIPSTPKTSKKGKVTKRTKTRSTRSRTNGATKASAEAAISLQEEFKSMKEKEKEKDKAQPAVSTPSRASSRAASTLRNQTPVVDESADSRVGKLCFAKWSDGTYYPAVVVSKNKTKFKVNFFDDKSKLVSEAFVYVINDTLSPNDIVCVEINEKDSYESSAVINEVEKDGDEVWYHLETEEKKNLRLTIKDIFLTPDHFKKFKESEIASAEVPSTPHFEKITLDNVIEGSRRHKSTTSPSASRASQAQSQGTSGSGKSAASNQSNAKKNYDTSDSDTKPEVVTELGDVNPEIAGISSASTSKGPSSRIKGKGKSKKKADDEETIKKFGPIPEPGSTLFKRFNFILTCAPLECLDAIKQAKPVPSDCSEEGTDYEVEWSSIPFLRERLVEQITAGGGRVYNTFDEIPPAEYSKTKLITNVPNITATSLLCLSVGILPYNHQWIITSCINNKLGSPEGSELPAGYSLRLENYVKNHERPGNKPFEHLKVVIPKISVAESSVNLWKRVIENAGGVVAFIDSPEDEFFDATVVVTNQNCPAWVEKKALSYEIPLVTTTWVVQCIVEGATVPGIEERCKHKKTSEPS